MKRSHDEFSIYRNLDHLISLDPAHCRVGVVRVASARRICLETASNHQQEHLEEARRSRQALERIAAALEKKLDVQKSD